MAENKNKLEIDTNSLDLISRYFLGYGDNGQPRAAWDIIKEGAQLFERHKKKKKKEEKKEKKKNKKKKKKNKKKSDGLANYVKKMEKGGNNYWK